MTNTGKRAGSEVVQMYIRDLFSSVTRPIKELKGFRARLPRAGETTAVELEITPEQLAFYDIDMKYVVEPGEFEIMVGNSSRDTDLQTVILTVCMTETYMPAKEQKLSFAEKAGYSLGDAAANFVFMTMILFQLSFYTDTMGVAAAAAGSLLLAGRLWDAVFDPMMGVIADRTKTRWGKFRPWVLWTAVPWAIAMVLAYTNPGWGAAGNLLWACRTNILLMTLYSANNTPYSAHDRRDDGRHQRAHQPFLISLRRRHARAVDRRRIYAAAGGQVRAGR